MDREYVYVGMQFIHDGRLLPLRSRTSSANWPIEREATMPMEPIIVKSEPVPSDSEWSRMLENQRAITDAMRTHYTKLVISGIVLGVFAGLALGAWLMRWSLIRDP